MSATSTSLPSTVYQSTTQLVMEGHLFDSLTLNKVLDYILTHNANFLLTNVSIGREKTDPSRVTMTLYAQNQEHLTRIVEELKIYGVQQPGSPTSDLAMVAQDGKAPVGAYILGYLPAELALSNGKTLASASEQSNPIYLVVDGDALAAVPQTQLKTGQQVVVGDAGLVWSH